MLNPKPIYQPLILSVCVIVLSLLFLGPYYLISEDPQKTLWHISTIPLAATGIGIVWFALRIIGNHRQNKRRLLKEKLFSRDASQDEETFLSHFEENQRPLAAAIRKALVQPFFLSSTRVRHDDPISLFLPLNIFKPIFLQCRHIGMYSLRQEQTVIWWSQQIKHHTEKGTTVQNLVQFITNLDRRLGEVLNE